MTSLSLSIRLWLSLVGSIFLTKIFDSQASFLGAEVEIFLKSSDFKFFF